VRSGFKVKGGRRRDHEGVDDDVEGRSPKGPVAMLIEVHSITSASMPAEAFFLPLLCEQHARARDDKVPHMCRGCDYCKKQLL
jgi:hypothetical protein